MEAIIQAWIDYCKLVLPEYTVTRAEELTGSDAPRPQGPYLTLKIISGPRYVQEDDWKTIENDETVTISGQREYTVSIKAFRSGHNDALSLVQARLQDPDFYDQLKASANISVSNKGDVIDISGKLETGYEGRSSLDINFYSSNNISTGIEVFDRVKIDGELTGEDEEVKEIDIPEIN